MWRIAVPKLWTCGGSLPAGCLSAQLGRKSSARDAAILFKNRLTDPFPGENLIQAFTILSRPSGSENRRPIEAENLAEPDNQRRGVKSHREGAADVPTRAVPPQVPHPP